MTRSRLLLVSSLCLAATASATWYGPSLPENSAFPGARLAALGGPRYLDSARCNQYSFAGDPAGLVGADTSTFVQLNLGMRQASLSGGGAERSHFDLMPEFRAGLRGAFGVRLAYQPVLEASRDSAGLPRFSTTDHRMVFDIAWANGPSQVFVGGLGATLRLGRQKQDTMQSIYVSPNRGNWERIHPSLEVLRLSLGSRIARSVTVTARTQVSGTLDSLEHTGGALVRGDTVFAQQDRIANMVLPGFGLAVQADNSDWPVRGVLDAYYGVNRRLGTTQSNLQAGSSANKHPVQIADSVHWRLLVQGRIDRPLPGHVFEPVAAMQYMSSDTKVYESKGQNNNPLDYGPEFANVQWTRSGFDLALGLSYAWQDRIRAVAEWERASTQIERDALMSQLFPDEDAVDHRVSLGLELVHTLVPALADKLPAGTGLAFRLGWQRLSLRGDELRPGWFSSMRRAFSNQDDFSAWDMTPGLGVASDASATTFGLGGWMLDRRLTLDLVLGLESWDPQPGPEQSGVSLGFDASWRM